MINCRERKLFDR